MPSGNDRRVVVPTLAEVSRSIRSVASSQEKAVKCAAAANENAMVAVSNHERSLAPPIGQRAHPPQYVKDAVQLIWEKSQQKMARSSAGQTKSELGNGGSPKMVFLIDGRAQDGQW